jgi:hemolysin activation/secretion protein
MNSFYIKKQISLFPVVAAVLLGSAASQAAPTPPDSGQIMREIQKQPVPVAPVTVNPLRIDEKSTPKTTSNDVVHIAVKKILLTGNKSFTTDELASLVANLADGEHTLTELNAGAERITSYYRERGFVVARAYLPEQDVKNGVVVIDVIEGLVGQKRVTNESRLTDERINSYLDRVNTGDVLQAKSIDRVLLLLNDLPGVGSARATLQPGSTVGSSDLLIQLDPSAAYAGNVELDNNGGRATGMNRLGVSLALNSPFKIGDQINLNALSSDQKMYYAKVAYQLPLGSYGLKLRAAYSESQYSVGEEFSSLLNHGKATSSSLNVTYPLISSQATNLAANLTWEDKTLVDLSDNPNSNVAQPFYSNKQVRLINLGLTGNYQDALGGGGITSFDVSLGNGTLNMDTATASNFLALNNGSFTKITYNLSRLQSLTERNTLSLMVSGQQTNTNLNSSEQFSVGGANGVRAYPQGEGTGDAGWLMNLELRHSFNSTLQGVLFHDAGSVNITHSPYVAGVNTRFISGYGLGVNTSFAGLQFRAYAAWQGSGGQPKSIPLSAVSTPTFWIKVTKNFG